MAMAELAPIQYNVKLLTTKLTAWLFILSVGVPVLLGPAHLTVKSKLMRAKGSQPGLALSEIQKSEKHYFHQKKKSHSSIFSMSCN